MVQGQKVLAKKKKKKESAMLWECAKPDNAEFAC